MRKTLLFMALALLLAACAPAVPVTQDVSNPRAVVREHQLQALADAVGHRLDGELALFRVVEDVARQLRDGGPAADGAEEPDGSPRRSRARRI